MKEGLLNLPKLFAWWGGGRSMLLATYSEILWLSVEIQQLYVAFPVWRAIRYCPGYKFHTFPALGWCQLVRLLWNRTPPVQVVQYSPLKITSTNCGDCNQLSCSHSRITNPFNPFQGSNLTGRVASSPFQKISPCSETCFLKCSRFFVCFAAVPGNKRWEFAGPDSFPFLSSGKNLCQFPGWGH